LTSCQNEFILTTTPFISADNQEQVWQTLYGDKAANEPKLKKEDCLAIDKTRFRKGYLPAWTKEIFSIYSAFRGNPPNYKL